MWQSLSHATKCRLHVKRIVMLAEENAKQQQTNNNEKVIVSDNTGEQPCRTCRTCCLAVLGERRKFSSNKLAIKCYQVKFHRTGQQLTRSLQMLYGRYCMPPCTCCLPCRTQVYWIGKESDWVAIRWSA